MHSYKWKRDSLRYRIRTLGREYIASRRVLEGIELGECDMRLKKELGGEVEMRFAYRRAGDKLMSSDLLFTLILRVIGLRLMRNVVKCEPSPLSRLLRALS